MSDNVPEYEKDFLQCLLKNNTSLKAASDFINIQRNHNIYNFQHTAQELLGRQHDCTSNVKFTQYNVLKDNVSVNALGSNIFTHVIDLMQKQELQYCLHKLYDNSCISNILTGEIAKWHFDEVNLHQPANTYILFLQIYSDKSSIDLLNRKMMWPFYLTCASLSDNLRHTSDARRHIGFFPVFHGEQQLPVYQRVLEWLLQPLIQFQDKPFPFKLINGEMINVVIRVIGTPVDLPETYLMSCLKFSPLTFQPCHLCHIPREHLSNIYPNGGIGNNTYRTREEMKNIYDARNKEDATANSMHMYPSALWNLLVPNHYQLASIDVLHMFHKGFALYIYKYIVNFWIKTLPNYKKLLQRLNTVFNNMLPFPGMKHFTRADKLPKITGHEMKLFMLIFDVALNGLLISVGSYTNRQLKEEHALVLLIMAYNEYYDAITTVTESLTDVFKRHVSSLGRVLHERLMSSPIFQYSPSQWKTIKVIIHTCFTYIYIFLIICIINYRFTVFFVI